MRGGLATAAEVTLGEWARISDGSITRYGDAVVGVFKNHVVSAFDITGWHRTAEGRVVFEGRESTQLGHLIGQAVPGEPWVPGAVRPVKTLDTRVVLGTEVPVDEGAGGILRATLGDTVVSVNEAGAVVVHVTPGRTVTVVVASEAA